MNIPQHARTLPAAPCQRRDRVAFATIDGRRAEGWVVGIIAPNGQPLIDILEDYEAVTGEPRRVHTGIRPEHVTVLQPRAFGKPCAPAKGREAA